MAKQYSALTGDHVAFVAAQPVFFVATAADGRVNVSPKGLEPLRVLDANRVCYLDHTGSSNDTAANLLRDGRITILFCAFTGKPLILKLYGTGRVVHKPDADWLGLAALFPPMQGARQIVVADIDLVVSSCGEGVPEMALQGQRAALPAWAAAKGDDGLRAYRQAKNRLSIDGFPTGLPEA